jgi:hypothetical protein
LLKAIEILINDLARARYPFVSVTKAMTRFMTCRQVENKSLADYVKRFKGNQDSLAQNMGKDFLNSFVKNTKQYTHYRNLPDCSNIAQIVLKSDQKSGQILQSGNEGSSGHLLASRILPIRLKKTQIEIFDRIASTIRSTLDYPGL